MGLLPALLLPPWSWICEPFRVESLIPSNNCSASSYLCRWWIIVPTLMIECVNRQYRCARFVEPSRRVAIKIIDECTESWDASVQSRQGNHCPGKCMGSDIVSC